MSDTKRSLEEQEATYGTGQQIVSEPDNPTQLKKENPKDELPQKVGTPDGRVLDLDTGEVSRPELIEISGRKIDVDEFGEKGTGFLQEMFNEYMLALQETLKTRFSDNALGVAEYGANSAKIIEEAGKVNFRLLSQVKSQRSPNKKSVLYKYVAWDGTKTFEDWLGWSIATLKWRINYELDNRAKLGFLGTGDLVLSKEVLTECVVTCEKFLAMSERQKMEDGE